MEREAKPQFKDYSTLAGVIGVTLLTALTTLLLQIILDGFSNRVTLADIRDFIAAPNPFAVIFLKFFPLFIFAYGVGLTVLDWIITFPHGFFGKKRIVLPYWMFITHSTILILCALLFISGLVE